ALFKELNKRNAKTIAYIGFSDALGDAALKEIERLSNETGIRLVASERYSRTDQSVTAQALKIVQSQADAVVFGASGTAAALPMRALRQRGYKGGFFQNHGVANNDFLRVAGDTGEGMISPTGLVLVAEQLPDSHPSKAVAMNYLKAYEGKHGAGSRNPFGAYAQDAYLLLDAALRKVGGKAAPGTPAFRAAVRDALEATRDLPVTHGVSTMSATDHSGLGEGAVALISIEKGTWKLLK
ncbi:MAG: ABC transporter substrate-binding protein, partial [Hydrogenophaga sp.]|nr:ABC transporter substrate-binding protein [Hydrogenophaga sp.]